MEWWKKLATHHLKMVNVKVGDQVRYTGENVTKGSVYTVTQVSKDFVVVDIGGGPFVIPPERFEKA